MLFEHRFTLNCNYFQLRKTDAKYGCFVPFEFVKSKKDAGAKRVKCTSKETYGTDKVLHIYLCNSSFVYRVFLKIRIKRHNF